MAMQPMLRGSVFWRTPHHLTYWVIELLLTSWAFNVNICSICLYTTPAHMVHRSRFCYVLEKVASNSQFISGQRACLAANYFGVWLLSVSLFQSCSCAGCLDLVKVTQHPCSRRKVELESCVWHRENLLPPKHVLRKRQNELPRLV